MKINLYNKVGINFSIFFYIYLSLYVPLSHPLLSHNSQMLHVRFFTLYKSKLHKAIYGHPSPSPLPQQQKLFAIYIGFFLVMEQKLKT